MNLADHPNETVATTNDDEAKALLSKLGVLQKMQNHRPPPGLLPSQAVRLDVWNHPTHWITALKYDGFERAEDNGFAVRCLPKSMFTLEQVKLQFEAEREAEFPNGVTDIPD